MTNHSTGVRAGPFPRRRGRARSTWRVEGAGLRVRDAVSCKVREHRMQETDVPSRVLIWDIRIYFRRTRASSRASAAHPRPRSPRSRGRWKQRICSAVAAQQCPAGTHRTGHPARSEPAASRQLTEPCRGRCIHMHKVIAIERRSGVHVGAVLVRVRLAMQMKCAGP